MMISVDEGRWVRMDDDDECRNAQKKVEDFPSFMAKKE
jgi:hypothetical protein